MIKPDIQIKLKPIGIINSPFLQKKGSPRQGRFSDEKSNIIIFNEYVEGLDGVEDFEYLHVIYWMDRADRNLLKATPPGKNHEKGIFALRSPVRPNPLGLCLVKLLKVKNNILIVKWLDALDKSLVIDIKPFWEDLDCP